MIGKNAKVTKIEELQPNSSKSELLKSNGKDKKEEENEYHESNGNISNTLKSHYC